MRLGGDETALLKQTIYEISPDARVYLFGSRVDDTKRGGDIDILILDDHFTKKDIRKLRLRFFAYFGEQKLDIVHDKTTPQKPFVKHILSGAKTL